MWSSLKSTELWSRTIDRHILSPAAPLILAALVGYTFPAPATFGECNSIRLADALFCSILFVLLWSACRLFRPVRWNWEWMVAVEFVAVPALWLFLVIALDFWFCRLLDSFDRIVL
jgi:hypothetical protein